MVSFMDVNCKFFCGLWLSSWNWNCEDPGSLGSFPHCFRKKKKKNFRIFKGDELGSLQVWYQSHHKYLQFYRL